jgi:hypothetical protein
MDVPPSGLGCYHTQAITMEHPAPTHPDEPTHYMMHQIPSIPPSTQDDAYEFETTKSD